MLSFMGGVIAASVVWFLVWRNNKTKFNDFITKMDDLAAGLEQGEVSIKISDILAKFKK